MKLYHGSNLEIKNPKILKQKRFLDFGSGFYLTSSYEQAEIWAKLKAKRNKNKSDKAYVSIFEIEEKNLTELKVLKFEKPDKEWLNFITLNRKGEKNLSDYDLIIGSVANDNTMPVLNLYFDGVLDEKETIKRLLPQKLKDQFTFKTEKALSFLKFIEVITL